MILYLKGSAALDAAIATLVEGTERKVFSLYCGGFSEITGWASFDKSKFVLLTGSDCSAAAVLKRVDSATAEMLWACGSGKAAVGSDFTLGIGPVRQTKMEFVKEYHSKDHTSIFAYGSPHIIKLDSLGEPFSERIKSSLNEDQTSIFTCGTPQHMIKLGGVAKHVKSALDKDEARDVRNPRHRHHATYKEWQKGGYDVEFHACGAWLPVDAPSWHKDYDYRLVAVTVDNPKHKWHALWKEQQRTGRKVEFRPRGENQWTPMQLCAWDSTTGEYRLVNKTSHVSDPSHVHHTLWQQYSRGAKIECRQTNGSWRELPHPNWGIYSSYRIKISVDMPEHKHHAVWKLWTHANSAGKEARVECKNSDGIAWAVTSTPDWDTNLEYRIVFPSADEPSHKHHAVWKQWKESVAKGYPLQIECRLADDRSWSPVLGEPNWLNRLQYRVKPFVPTKRIEGKIGDTIFSYLAPSEAQVDGWFKCGRFYWEPKARATYHEVTKLMRGMPNGN